MGGFGVCRKRLGGREASGSALSRGSRGSRAARPELFMQDARRAPLAGAGRAEPPEKGR